MQILAQIFTSFVLVLMSELSFDIKFIRLLVTCKIKSILSLSTKYCRSNHFNFRDASGKTDDTPRWKTCVSTAAGSFSAAVGQLYVTKHFNEEAKEKMMEMVHDIKDEFKMILDEVKWMDEGDFFSFS